MSAVRLRQRSKTDEQKNAPELPIGRFPKSKSLGGNRVILVVRRQQSESAIVTSEDLLRSWKRTEDFLRDARSHFSEAGESICVDQLQAFDEYLQHNELEIALDMLEEAFDKSEMESWRVLELMAMAAASMGLIDRQRRYDRRLSDARSWKYETILPS